MTQKQNKKKVQFRLGPREVMQEFRSLPYMQMIPVQTLALCIVPEHYWV